MALRMMSGMYGIETGGHLHAGHPFALSGLGQ